MIVRAAVGLGFGLVRGEGGGAAHGREQGALCALALPTVLPIVERRSRAQTASCLGLRLLRAGLNGLRNSERVFHREAGQRQGRGCVDQMGC